LEYVTQQVAAQASGFNEVRQTICVILSNSSFASWRGKNKAYSSPHCRPMKKNNPVISFYPTVVF
jgi:hypothetical protein